MALNKIKIFLVDDHELFRDGLKILLELNNIGTIIAEASTGKEYLKKIKDYDPDIVLMDIDMPEMNGIEATKKSIELKPELQILALSMFGDEQYYYQMIDAGAKGFILKTANKSELLEAINAVLKGSNYFSGELLLDIAKKMGMKSNVSKNSNYVHYNEKETKILELIRHGFSTNEIADKINLSPKTVSNYRTLLLEKTGCKNSISLVIYAIKNNIIQL